MIKTGKIIDSKTICAVMIYAAKKKVIVIFFYYYLKNIKNIIDNLV